MVRASRSTRRRGVAAATGNHNVNSMVLMQPTKIESPTTTTKMVPIAPRIDTNSSNSTMYTCSYCAQPIVERFFLHAQDRSSRGNYYHVQCLRCQCCDVALADIASTFYTKDNTFLCKSDYLKKYGSRPCSLCSRMIGTNEQIMRVNSNYVYHLSCFTCVKCQTPLVKGDRYVLVNEQLFCEKDNPLQTINNNNNNRTTNSKRGTTTNKRGGKANNRTIMTTTAQTTFITPSSYYNPGHVSLLNNHPTTSTITHSLLSNNNNISSGSINALSSMTMATNSDELF